jgi:hypothetical protein
MTSDVNGTVVAIQSVPVSSTAPTTDQVLQYNGTEYVPASLPTSLPPDGMAGGDLGGTYPNPTVVSVADVTTGVLPAANQAAQTMGGDVSGTTSSATVVKIQGNPVNNETLGASEDGYVFTWDNTDGYIVARPTAATYTGLRKDYFTSNSTWTCPAGVSNVMVIAAGGGGGGASGTSSSGNYTAGGGGGGGASLQQVCYATVSAGTNYTITIGTGGSGGTGNNTSIGNGGSNGSPTQLSNGATIIVTCIGAQGGGQSNQVEFGGQNIAATGTDGVNIFYEAGFGGRGSIGSSGINGTGQPNYVGGYAGGSQGSYSGNFGGGGGAGPQGPGGNGGAAGANATSASANTGAGGGGGGGNGNNNNSGSGGNGGSGYLYIIY